VVVPWWSCASWCVLLMYSSGNWLGKAIHHHGFYASSPLLWCVRRSKELKRVYNKVAPNSKKGNTIVVC
jgi:hypothetical protein